MKSIATTNILLAIVSLLLFVIAVRPLRSPEPVQAQSSSSDTLYFEPGVYLLRAPDSSQQTFGKVAVDLRNGKVWAFPTYGHQPYPMSSVDSKPQTSHPFQLGRFVLEDMIR